MDAHHFDSLIKHLVSRRTGVGLALAGLLGVPVPVIEAKKKKKPCPPCRKRKKGKCKATLPDGSSCSGGTCQGGQCVAAPACGTGGPCLVFLSSLLYNGNLDGLSGADAKCQQLATAANLPGTYKAWLSDSTGSVASRFVPSPGPYQLVNGTQVAANFADLTDGTLAASIDLTETGGGMGSTAFVYTGTRPDGVAQFTDTCANWTSGAAGNGRIGLASNAEPNIWTDFLNGTVPCSAAVHLYCFQQR